MEQGKMIPPPLEPITAKVWDQFNGKGRWDITVALRGPDFVNSARLKWITTSVLRHRMSGVIRVGGLVNANQPFVMLPSKKDFAKYPNFDFGHFRDHVSEAAELLAVPRVFIPPCPDINWESEEASNGFYLKIAAKLQAETDSEAARDAVAWINSCFKGYL